MIVLLQKDFKVIPDMITMAKGITKVTVPMGAVGVNSKIYQTLIKKERKIELFSWIHLLRHPLCMCCRDYIRSISRGEVI